MIELAKYNDEFIIRFSPWGEDDKGQKKPGLPLITKTLLYGHFCPKCKNVIQAAFLTDSSLDTRGYEELNTTITDKDGKRRIVRTGINPRFKSKYDSTLARKGDKISAQLIKLKEHFDAHPNEDTWNSFCHFVAHFSFRPDIVLQEIILGSNIDPSLYRVSDISNEKLIHYMSTTYMKDGYAVVSDFVGKMPEITLVRRNTSNYYLCSFLSEYYIGNTSAPALPF